MSICLYVGGSAFHYVRIGFSGQRPLIYAIYAIDSNFILPSVPGQAYKEITIEQYEWLRYHLNCDVSYIPSGWVEIGCGLECRTHREFYQLLNDKEPYVPDYWFDRQI